MRLKKIKLAGFKSFVDPTTVEVPGSLIGIVGPNGCGKSNIIDAVRWVMGEISAKHLRGESMADVVFSGSSSRKPVGQASVELVFDNTDGRLGGQYAAYNEISVRRVVTREAAQSHYYLNGSRCRRRDVTDVFLGTGLGPRSYAIIEQGMISRLIEAKPDELREFLEEAAGISKYKERRRETENRISHTNENLERLSDLREELGKRLQHLKRQATMAEKFKVLKAEERTLKAQLMALKWRALDAQVEVEASHIGAQNNALESAIAEQRQLESALEKKRVEQTELNEKFNESYRHVLDAGAEIARVEESIAHLRSRQTELRESLSREQRMLDEARGHNQAEKAELEELSGALDHEQPELERLQGVENDSKVELGRIEEVMRDVQGRWEALSLEAAEPNEIIHAETARIGHLEQHIEQLAQRVLKLEDEFGGLRPDELEADIAPLSEKVDLQATDLQAMELELQEKQQRITTLRENISHASAQLHQTQEQSQALSGQLASLERLQEEVLGQRSDSVANWLSGHELTDTSRLAQAIEVDNGWERAVETVLGFHLESVCVDALEVGIDLTRLDEGAIGLLEIGEQQLAMASHPTLGLPCLAEHVRAPASARALLVGAYAVENLEQAVAIRTRLQPGESVVTRDGIWVGCNWMRVARSAVDGQGIIAREQEIKSLHNDLLVAQNELSRIEALREVASSELQDNDQAAAAMRQSFAEGNRQFAEQRADLSARQAGLEQARERATRIRKEVAELRAQEQQEQHQLVEARKRLDDAQTEASRFAQLQEEQAARRQAQAERLELAREQWQVVRDDVYEVGVRAESMRTKLASLRSAVVRSQQHVETLESRIVELNASFNATTEPLSAAGQELEQKLAARSGLERALEVARVAVEAVDEALRQLDLHRGSIEKSVNEERTELERLNMQAQETRVRRTTLEEQLAEAGDELKTTLEALPEEAEVIAWEEQVEKMERRITRLGPINLAAIEECDQQAERKQYLDAQNEDLVQALDTLLEAIQKIDLETRARFKDTYERVNTGLSEAFPRLFGGGHAFLEMTGDDLLSTGITMVARPPGKRNTSIHLLSGGEKALSAIALVFSIFDLNPAPFCLLDEVDAPLDDANVGRFCDLVSSMTDRVQFLVVTHNKTTMEMTQQLLGITMSEPGISRLVAVDVEEAAAMAAV